MQIVCPACAATYDVPPTLLKPGLAVRCVRCTREWVPAPAPPEPEAVAPTPMPPEPLPFAPPLPEPPIFRPLPERPRPKPNFALPIAWIASVAVLLLALGAGYTERADIMRIWPPSVRLYAALGLTADH